MQPPLRDARARQVGESIASCDKPKNTHFSGQAGHLAIATAAAAARALPH
jgi:hypothetical protein